MTGRFLKLIAGIMVLSLIAGCSKSANNSKGNVEIQINTVGGLNTAAVDATSLIKTAPSVSTEILKNPGKGWFIYGDGENNLTPFSSQPLAWQYASVGYCRYDWAVLEPEEGKYDWSYIDSAIEFCRNNGAKFAFGVMSINPTSKTEYITPKWVFDAGAKCYRSNIYNSLVDSPEASVQYVPEFSDDIYIEKLQNFANALAKRYGNNPDIEFIDIRCYGSWGENNMYDVEAYYKNRPDTGVDGETMWRCWETYINAFKDTDTQLMVAYSLGDNACKDIFERAIDAGVGLRNDGLLHWTSSGTGASNIWADGKTPSVLELAASYGYIKNKGSWDAGLFEETITTTRTSYYPLGGASNNDATKFVTENKELIEAMSNRIGYHFTLNEVMVSPKLGQGDNDVLIMRWTNGGNAPAYKKLYAAAALIDEKGKIADICWLDGVDMSKVTPSMDNKTEYKSVTLASPLKFSKHNEGKYKLAIGLFTSKDLKNPDVKIGNKEQTDNWYTAYSPDGIALENVNYAAFASVTASSVFSDKFSAQSITDMDYTSAWSSAVTNEPQTVNIDLGKERELSTVELYWGQNYAKQYRVLLSSDNENFKEVYATSTSDGGKDYIGFEMQKARYIRLILESADQSGDESAGFEAKQGVNILRNGDFENGLNSWTMSDCTAEISSDAHGGTSSARVAARTSDLGCLKQSIAARLNQTGTGKYEVSGWFKASHNALATISMHIKGSEDWGNDYFIELGELKAGEWTKLSAVLDVQWKGKVSYAHISAPDTMLSEIEALVDDLEMKKLEPVSGEIEFKPITEGSYTLLEAFAY